jgi:hypothetical protein
VTGDRQLRTVDPRHVHYNLVRYPMAFPDGVPKVSAAFAAASRLIALYRKFASELDQHAKAATPAS